MKLSDLHTFRIFVVFVLAFTLTLVSPKQVHSTDYQLFGVSFLGDVYHIDIDGTGDIGTSLANLRVFTGDYRYLALEFVDGSFYTVVQNLNPSEGYAKLVEFDLSFQDIYINESSKYSVNCLGKSAGGKLAACFPNSFGGSIQYIGELDPEDAQISGQQLVGTGGFTLSGLSNNSSGDWIGVEMQSVTWFMFEIDPDNGNASPWCSPPGSPCWETARKYEAIAVNPNNGVMYGAVDDTFNTETDIFVISASYSSPYTVTETYVGSIDIDGGDFVTGLTFVDMDPPACDTSDDLTLSSQTISTHTYHKVTGDIEVDDVTVDSSALLRLSAGSSIKLSPDFSVEDGARLKAYVSPLVCG